MIRIEFGVNCAGTNLYLSRRFRKKGWKGRRNPHRKNSSYRATRPGWSDITLSSGPGADRWIKSGTLYMTLRASTSSAVMVEATPPGPAGSEPIVEESAGLREDRGTALMGEVELDGCSLATGRSRMVTPPSSRGIWSTEGARSSLSNWGDSIMGLLPFLMARWSMDQKEMETNLEIKGDIGNEGLRSQKELRGEEGEESSSSVRNFSEQQCKEFLRTPRVLLYLHFQIAPTEVPPRDLRPLRHELGAGNLVRARGVTPRFRHDRWDPQPIAMHGKRRGNDGARLFPIIREAPPSGRPVPTSSPTDSIITEDFQSDTASGACASSSAIKTHITGYHFFEFLRPFRPKDSRHVALRAQVQGGI